MTEIKVVWAPSSWELAKTFLHLGATAYGGLAMVEPIRRRIVQEKAWLSEKEFLDGLALCQLVPGATVVQLAAYVGYHLRKTRGALAAAGAFILPAFLLMLSLSWLYCRYGELAWVTTVSKGLGAVVIALLIQTLWRFQEIVRRHWLDAALTLLTLGALWGGVNYLAVFLGAGLLRLVLGWKLFGLMGTHEEGAVSAAPNPGLMISQVVGALILLALAVWGLWHINEQLGVMSLTFLKIGVIAFGGGYVMIPILQWDMVDNLGWLTLRQFLDGILLGFVTPGPIIITATFIGYWIKGLAGAVVGTVSIFLPPILIIIFLSPYYQWVKETRWMRPVIQGILCALVGMLVLVVFQMGRASLVDWQSWTIMLGAAMALVALRINLLSVVVAAAGLSLLIF
ncbi:MAG: chromate efflux transporter [Thermodesulfobacteriota bacterium]